MVDISIISGVIVFFVAAFFARRYATGCTYPPMISWTFSAIAIIYGMGWSLVIDSIFSGSEGIEGENWIIYSRNYLILHSVAVFIMMAGIILGWQVAGKYSNHIKKYFFINFSLSSKKLSFYAWIILIIGIFLRYLYVQAYGGWIDYLEYSATIRSGIFEINNSWSFLQPFGGLSLISSYLFFSAWHDAQHRGWKRRLTILGFFLAFLFSLYVLYSWLGRIGFVFFLATFFIFYLLNKKISSPVIISIALFGSIFAIYIIYLVSNYLELKGANSFAFFIAREISFPFVGFFAQFQRDEFLYRGFIDFIYSPLHLLPSSWTQNWFDDISEINTLVISGAKKGNYGVTGSIPVDLITLGIMQFSIAGIPIVGVMFGILIRFIQSMCEGIGGVFGIMLLAYFSIRLAFLAVFYAHPSHVIASNFSVLVCLIIIFALSKGSSIVKNSLR
ncbi:hypothetical protein SAMN02745117_01737 [Lampropedia hyalina DSM 16112]|jgi:hypothetical protein|uniref:Oligosaccharide repeat unit polymerase n=1 Tax=Lampropedia hyalina DSM 16112 TaxID=1122156 RepID=A0A1M5AQR0_9BURK|nr:O-antigen polymerase [Lampropedia hyalina]SHF32598.1 hypothetical protein SAMN02745117_01737 [Lampropedia hyalina DSM 16112]